MTDICHRSELIMSYAPTSYNSASTIANGMRRKSESLETLESRLAPAQDTTYVHGILAAHRLTDVIRNVEMK